MRKVLVRVGGVAAAASVALTLAAVGPAFASPAAKTVTGPEVIAGVTHGAAALANSPAIPLTFTGVVPTTDRGFVLGNGSGNAHTLVTPAGKLGVTGIGKQVQTQTANMRTCYFTFTGRQQFTFAPGRSTGKFAGASGPGAYQVSFAAYEPRYTSGKHKGQCDGNAQPLDKGAVAKFLAAGVLTVG